MRYLTGLCLALGLAATDAAAFNPDPDWPCVQRKVAHLSWGQMWSGPPLPEDGAWRGDAALAALVPHLAARRTPLEEVRDAVGALKAEGDDARLVALFAGVFETIERHRAKLVDGIGRYSRKQQGLTAKIDAMRSEVDHLRADTAADDFDGLDRIEEMEDQIFWETKIYNDRRQSLTYVCESPVMLEKRAFAVARIVQEALGE